MPRPPNILWIVTTQWRAQACGYAGDVNAHTPVLNRLAQRGINFAQAVTPHPFGPFARAALLTGVASPKNGVADYFDPLPLAARTVAHDLNDRGYVTAYFGKWHLAPRDRNVPLVGDAHAKTMVPPNARGGFSFWEGFEGGFLLNDPWLHGTRIETPHQFPGYQSDVITSRAADWLARQDEPWFAVVSMEAPHPPYAAPASGVLAVSAAEISLPANVPRGGEIEVRARRELAGYYAHIAATDRSLERLLDLRETEGRRGRPTIAVVTSVHGDMHGAHGYFRKGWPYEEAIRVPLLVAGLENAPHASADAVSLVDLRAWAVAWADGQAERRPPSHAAISMPSVVALPDQCDRIWSGVRSQTRKLALHADGSPWLLFDLENDPSELTNRAVDPRWQDELRRLRALLVR